MSYPVRKSPRLPNYDYSSTNYYFITICTHEKKCFFGNLNQLNALGKIAQQNIIDIPQHYTGVSVDCYVIMPNHIHIMLSLSVEDGRGDPSPTVTSVMGWLKYNATKRINEIRGTVGSRVFQRSFYDRVVRDMDEYIALLRYIDENPKRWFFDELYSEDELVQ